MLDGSLMQDPTVLELDIRPGWKDGTKITFEGAGDQYADPRIPAADIVFVIREKPHSIFKREKDNLTMLASVTLKDALVGVTVQVKTIEGKTLKISVPDNIVVYPGYTMNVSGRGMPNSKNPSLRGDLKIKFEVKFPTSLSKEQKRKLADIL